jgi:serine/threonine protein kinase/tetratricopeptide (TPR) repeat protein
VIGRTLAHYTITAKIGEGGMGEVYRARDTKLDREVALKILPAETASDPVRLARFRQEARALAALNHPNIVTIYSVEEAEGVHLLTMELVDGQSLDHCLPPEGFPPADLFRIGISLAEALQAAHESGIVHRDLKPANVMLTTQGRVKVLDFGLAKTAAGESTEAAVTRVIGAAPLTTEGILLGTVPYMAPEQLQGRPVDARTDLFSLGVLLYELASGRRPFTDDSTAGLMSAILKDTPTPVTRHRPGIPEGLSRLITRCLAKEPNHRIQTARDIYNELRALQSGDHETAGTSRQRGHGIAVLPFADMSPAKDQDFFCEGMAEEIMNALVPIPGLRVASRTSAFRARSENRDLPDIGRALNVGHVLEGSVRVAGTRMRVIAQLVDVKSGYHLWSQRFDRDAEGVFAVQDEIAAGVVEAVRSHLAGEDRHALQGRPVRARAQVKNLEAYRHYLKGRYLRFRNDHAAASASYRKAVELDPTHGPSWVGLAETAVLCATYAMRQARPALDEARRALITAEKLQGETADAHCVRGMIAFCERDWPAVEDAFNRALTTAPEQVQAACWLGMALAAQQRGDECAAVFERARAMDPLAAFPYGMSGLSLLLVGRVDEAERYLEVGLDLEPGHTLALWSHASVLVHRGRYDEAIADLETAAASTNRAPHYVGVLAWTLARAGRGDEARSLLGGLVARPAPADSPGSPAPAVTAAAWAWGELGDRDTAWTILEAAREERQTLILLTGHPGFDPFRTDPRWPGFVESLGLGSTNRS